MSEARYTNEHEWIRIDGHIAIAAGDVAARLHLFSLAMTPPRIEVALQPHHRPPGNSRLVGCTVFMVDDHTLGLNPSASDGLR